MYSIIKNLFKTHRELISYLVIGVMTTIISWGSYGIFASLLSPGLSGLILGMPSAVLAANALSWICAVLFSFVLNKTLVFLSRSWKASVLLPELARFVSSRLATGILETLTVPAAVSLGLSGTLFGVEGMLTKVVASLSFVIINYLVSKLWVFRST